MYSLELQINPPIRKEGRRNLMAQNAEKGHSCPSLFFFHIVDRLFFQIEHATIVAVDTFVTKVLLKKRAIPVLV